MGTSVGSRSSYANTYRTATADKPAFRPIGGNQGGQGMNYGVPDKSGWIYHNSTPDPIQSVNMRDRLILALGFSLLEFWKSDPMVV